MLYGVKDIARNLLGMSSHSDRLRKNEFWAVDDISFELKRGETLGIIGPNGSGKTTLLKMLNGIFWPDKGKITIKNRVGALIAVGAGFHPMLTGKDNIYINSAILGMTKGEIDEKFEEIVEFADIGDFIDVPVKFYSSGMFVRLGFSVAAHCEPDVLLVDEVLAVGDSNFIIKSLNKISSLVKRNNISLVYVSHSTTMVRAVCQKALYMENGRCIEFGEVEDVIRAYELASLEKRMGSLSGDYQRIKSKRKAEITQVTLLDEKNHEKDLFKIGEFLKIRVELNTEEKLKQPAIEIVIFNEKGECMANQISKTDGYVFPPLTGKAYVDFLIERIPFNQGIYSLSVKLIDGGLVDSIDYHKEICHFKIERGNKIGYDARTYLDGKWMCHMDEIA